MKINDLIRRRNEASSRGHANKGGITKTVSWCKANITQRKIGEIVYKDKFDVILIMQHQWVQRGEGEKVSAWHVCDLGRCFLLKQGRSIPFPKVGASSAPPDWGTTLR